MQTPVTSRQQSEAVSSERIHSRDPILVVVQHSALLAHPKLGETFRGDDGLLLVRCPEGDPRAYTSLLVSCVYIADISILEAVKDIAGSQQPRQTSVLLMGPTISRDETKAIIFAGAMGYIEESAPLSEVKNAVRAVMRGEYWTDRSILTELIQELMAVPATAALTSRELEVLRLLPAGCTNRVIADTLGVTYETVRWHLRSIYAKLGVKDRVGAIARGKQIQVTRSRRTVASPELHFTRPSLLASKLPKP